MISNNQICKLSFILTGMIMTFAFVQTAAAQQKNNAKAVKPKTQSVRVEITQSGYDPVSVTLRRGGERESRSRG